jgi:hypothetical protein
VYLLSGGREIERNCPKVVDLGYAPGLAVGPESYNYDGGIMENPSESAVKRRPTPREKLVRIFDTEQESEAMVVRGLLESTGIDADLTSLDAPQDVLPGVGGTVVLVREEDAAKARRVIAEYRQAPDDDDDDSEDRPGPS